MTNRARYGCVLVLAAALAAGCAPQPKHTDAGRDYDKTHAFSFVPPDGWAKTGFVHGGIIEYSDPACRGAVSLSVHLDTPAQAGVELKDFMPSAKRVTAVLGLENYTFLEEGTLTIHGRHAGFLLGKHTVNGASMMNLQYVIQGDFNPWFYTLTFRCPEGDFARCRPIFEKCAMSALTD